MRARLLRALSWLNTLAAAGLTLKESMALIRRRSRS